MPLGADELELRRTEVAGDAGEFRRLQRLAAETQQVVFQEGVPDLALRVVVERPGKVEPRHFRAERVAKRSDFDHPACLLRMAMGGRRLRHLGGPGRFLDLFLWSLNYRTAALAGANRLIC